MVSSKRHGIDMAAPWKRHGATMSGSKRHCFRHGGFKAPTSRHGDSTQGPWGPDDAAMAPLWCPHAGLEMPWGRHGNSMESSLSRHGVSRVLAVFQAPTANTAQHNRPSVHKAPRRTPGMYHRGHDAVVLFILIPCGLGSGRPCITCHYPPFLQLVKIMQARCELNVTSNNAHASRPGPRHKNNGPIYCGSKLGLDQAILLVLVLL